MDNGDHSSANGLDAILRLKREIESLSEQQTETLKTATFLGMTSDEAKAYDARRVQITDLVRKLAQLTETRTPASASPSNIASPKPELILAQNDLDNLRSVATPVEPTSTTSPTPISRTPEP